MVPEAQKRKTIGELMKYLDVELNIRGVSSRAVYGQVAKVTQRLVQDSRQDKIRLAGLHVWNLLLSKYEGVLVGDIPLPHYRLLLDRC